MYEYKMCKFAVTRFLVGNGFNHYGVLPLTVADTIVPSQKNFFNTTQNQFNTLKDLVNYF